MTLDELAELMAEPPGGENHGRVRTEGGWRSLENAYEGADLPYVIHDPEYRARDRYETRAAHGTRTRYRHGPCRCLLCRQAERDYRRSYRNRKRGVS